MLFDLAGISSALATERQIALWPQFWAIIIVLIGISIVVRGAVVLLAGQTCIDKGKTKNLKDNGQRVN